MKCMACGREMLNKGTHLECCNILCDYEEEIENNGVFIKPKKERPGFIFNKPRQFLTERQRRFKHESFA